MHGRCDIRTETSGSDLETQEVVMSHHAVNTDSFVARIPFLGRGATGFTAFIAGRARTALRRWQKRRTIRALERLSDWVLADIGISRGEIPRVVDSLVADDPRPASLARTAAVARHGQSSKGG